MADSSTKRKKKPPVSVDEVAVPDIRANELKLNEKIGGGCFGVVHKGICRGKVVGIKKLHQQDLEDKTMQEFKKEVAILTHLRHPNIVLFMGACTEPGNLAIVTEFMANGDLHTLLRNPNIKLSHIKLLEMARQVSQAMTWLHCSNPPIIHRDLKPSNILVDENMNVKVCDFGLSAFQKTKFLQDKGVAPGTPLWMSPEVLQGKPLKEKVDVYSFAMVLWEMFTGQEPFEEYDSYDIFVEAVCLRDERPEFPENFPLCVKTIITDCWSVNVDARPSFDQITERLNGALVDISIVNDHSAAHMWKKHWPGELSTTWNKFIPVFAKIVGITLPHPPDNDDTYKSLKNILTGNGDTDGTTVTLDRFGHFLKWFGPLHSTNAGNVAARLVNLMKYKWFHGDLTREKSELQLAEFDKGTFLVRVSTTEPIERAPFTISKVTKNGEINHQRIYVKTENSFGYFTHVKYKTGTKKIEVDGGLDLLIAHVKKDLGLKKECPGWPYAALFTSVEAKYQLDYDVAEDSDSSKNSE